MDFVHNIDQIALYGPDGQLKAEVTYHLVDDNTVEVDHTFVHDSLKGQGVAGKLMEELADELRAEGKKAVLTCTYAVSWFQKHREAYSDILR